MNPSVGLHLPIIGIPYWRWDDHSPPKKKKRDFWPGRTMVFKDDLDGPHCINGEDEEPDHDEISQS